MNNCVICDRPIKRTVRHNDWSYNQKIYCSSSCQSIGQALNAIIKKGKEKGLKINVEQINGGFDISWKTIHWPKKVIKFLTSH